jgi:hypothetical protein
VIFLRPLGSSGTFNSFWSFPSRELFFIHGHSFAVPTKLCQRLLSVYTSTSSALTHSRGFYNMLVA